MAAKTRTRLCARCHKQQRTGNAYCKACDAIRKAEARGKVAQPETEGEQEVRGIVDKTFDLLDAVSGAEVEVKGIKVRSNMDGTVSFHLNRDQRRRASDRLRALKGA